MKRKTARSRRQAETNLARAQPSPVTPEPVAAEAAPATPPPDGAGVGSRGSGVVVVILALFALGGLLLSASAVPPARVPWPVVAESLSLHRSDLAAVGIGALAFGILWLNVAVLL